MPDLLLELFSEEIPARMQRRAAEDLRTLVTDALVEAGLVYEGAKAFVTPRRLALTVHGLPRRSPDRREDRKGPRVGAPEKAIEGFLRAAGLKSIDEATVQADKKGDFYLAVVEKPGRPAEEWIAEIVPRVVRSFPWPKSMRWGALSAKPGSLSWVRPLHTILCTFGPETEEPVVVGFDIDGIRSGNVTRGHRFMAPGEIVVRRFDDYAGKLEKAKVVLDPDRRQDIILHGARDQALAVGLELIEDEGLLAEVAGLVEWPVVLLGSFDEAFLAIPPEVIRTTIRANQKCFVLRRGGSKGGIANRFILVSNIVASDGGKAIVAGNERVIRARLSDARHFWDTDRRDLPDLDRYAAAGKRLRLDLKKPLDQRMAKLAATDVVFHEKLGTQGDRVERIVRLAGEIADTLSRQPDFFAGKNLSADDLAGEQQAFRHKVERAALLAKADLVSEMVGEFPELQGLMGGYYATAQGEDPSVAAAIEDHYKPLGPSDRVPTDPVAIAVALADKLDTLVGFWAIDEKPTGSKDPYALRRAALGVIRIALENRLRLPIHAVLSSILRRELLGHGRHEMGVGDEFVFTHALVFRDRVVGQTVSRQRGTPFTFDQEMGFIAENRTAVSADLLAFFHDRLKVQLREQGARHDLVDAVLAPGQGAPLPLPGGERSTPSVGEAAGEGGSTSPTQSPHPDRPPGAARSDLSPPGRGESAPQDDLLLIVRRVEALGKFLDTDDGKNLLAGYRRAANILRDEEKKDAVRYDTAVDAALLAEPAEKALDASLDTVLPEATAAVSHEDFGTAMAALARLRPPVDAFFDKVRVNDPDPAVRANRLKLLNRIREATRAVADFSKVEG